MKTITNVKELREALGENACEQKILVFSKSKKEWVTAKMRTESLAEKIEGILNCKTEAEFKELPKIALMFEYEGTENDYKPGIIAFQDTYEDAFRKIVSNDFALVFKREVVNTTEEDGIISTNAMKAFGTLRDEKPVTTEKAKSKNKDKVVA